MSVQVQTHWKANGDQVDVLVSTTYAPDVDRVPVDLICLIDTSGSMRSKAGNNVDDPTAIALVVHALKTLLTMLSDNDRFSIITYSSQAMITAPLTLVDAAGRKLLQEAIAKISVSGTTNIWAALELALKVASEAAAVPTATARCSHIVLLTDGQPTVSPPTGEAAAYKALLTKLDFAAPPTLHTFGFGYGVNASLLTQCASVGRGTYGFIPDASCVGSLFVNFVAAILTTPTTDARITVSLDDTLFPKHVLVASTPGLGTETDRWGVSVPLGALRSGQPRRFILSFASPPDSEPASRPALDTSSSIGTVHVQIPSSTDEPPLRHEARIVTNGADGEAEMAAQRARKAALTLYSAIALANGSTAVAAAATEVASAFSDVQAAWGGGAAELANSYPSEQCDSDCGPLLRTGGLHKDLCGEVASAVATKAAWDKWGSLYVPSLSSALQLELCNNFKDPGVQGFAYGAFAVLRASGGVSFKEIPLVLDIGSGMPTYGRPHTASRGGGAPMAMAMASAPRVASASRYYDRSGGCIHATSMVDVVAGGVGGMRAARDVRRGDVVRTAGGGVGTVVAVVRTVVGAVASMVRVSTASAAPLMVTAWHPIRLVGSPSGAYAFPHTMPGVTTADVPTVDGHVYTFVVVDGLVDTSTMTAAAAAGDLDALLGALAGVSVSRGVVVAQHYEVAGLGHGVTDDAVLRHPFLGSVDVVERLATFAGFAAADGVITLTQDAYVRGPDMAIVDLDPSFEVPVDGLDVRVGMPDEPMAHAVPHAIPVF